MTRYQITVRVEGLPRRRWLGLHSRPNPYCDIRITGGPRQQQQASPIVGKTETFKRTQNPRFAKIIFIDTDPSEYVPIQIRVYDDRGYRSYDGVDENGADDGTSRNPTVATANFEITEIIRSPGHCMMQTSVNSTNIKIYASVEESIKGTENPSDIFRIQLRALELKNVEFGYFGLDRSDPYFEISKKAYDHNSGYVNWVPMMRSEPITNHLNPVWKARDDLTIEEVCYCDLKWPLKISVYDYNRNIDTVPIGEIETNLEDIINHIAIRGNADRERAFRLHRINEKQNNHNVDEEINGYIVVLQADIISMDGKQYQANDNIGDRA